MRRGSWGMSTDDLAYSEQMPLQRRRGPEFGHIGPPPETEHEEIPDRLGRRPEAILAVAIVVPAAAAYAAIIYGLYVAVTSLT